MGKKTTSNRIREEKKPANKKQHFRIPGRSVSVLCCFTCFKLNSVSRVQLIAIFWMHPLYQFQWKALEWTFMQPWPSRAFNIWEAPRSCRTSEPEATDRITFHSKTFWITTRPKLSIFLRYLQVLCFFGGNRVHKNYCWWTKSHSQPPWDG